MAITVGGSPPPGMVGDAEYHAELTAIGGTPPYTWSSDPPPPAGLELAPLPPGEHAEIRGTPAQDGSAKCTISVTDGTEMATYEVYLTIYPKLAISTPNDLPPAVEGKRYAAVLDAEGGDGRYTWAASDTPDWLSLDTNSGAITGIPTTAGTTRFTIRVTDKAAHADEGDLTITIRHARWWGRLFHIGNWLALLALGIPTFGSLWIVIYAFATQGSHWSYLGVGMSTALAAFLSGCLLGFLFGIPRVVSSGQLRHDKGSEAYSPSSNLAEVSDWLTKLLLGAGLVQLTRLGAPISHLIDNVAAGLTSSNAISGPSSAAKVMAAGILFGYVVIGLLDAYVVTTVWYQNKLASN